MKIPCRFLLLAIPVVLVPLLWVVNQRVNPPEVKAVRSYMKYDSFEVGPYLSSQHLKQWMDSRKNGQPPATSFIIQDSYTFPSNGLPFPVVNLHKKFVPSPLVVDIGWYSNHDNAFQLHLCGSGEVGRTNNWSYHGEMGAFCTKILTPIELQKVRTILETMPPVDTDVQRMEDGFFFSYDCSNGWQMRLYNQKHLPAVVKQIMQLMGQKWKAK